MTTEEILAVPGLYSWTYRIDRVCCVFVPASDVVTMRFENQNRPETPALEGNRTVLYRPIIVFGREAPTSIEVFDPLRFANSFREMTGFTPATAPFVFPLSL